MPFSSHSSPGCLAFLHIKCLGKSDLAFAFWKNNAENTTFISHFYHGSGISWSSSLFDPPYRLQGCCLGTAAWLDSLLVCVSHEQTVSFLKAALEVGSFGLVTWAELRVSKVRALKCLYMHLCDLGGNLYPVMLGVGIPFVSLLHISFQENVFMPIYFMAAKCKGDPQELGKSLNWCKNLEDVKIRWPCLALKRFHWQSVNELTLWGSNQQALSDTRD